VPFWGGRMFVFFEPVFNIADAAISIGIVTLLIFQKTLLEQPSKEKEEVTTESQTTNA
jgi:signal peptidase II